MDTSLIENQIVLSHLDKYAAIIGLNPSNGARSPKLWNAAFIEYGTERLYEQCRVIFPFKTSFYECTLEYHAPQLVFQMCTIFEIPRLPKYCIAYELEVLLKKAFDEKKCNMDSMTLL